MDYIELMCYCGYDLEKANEIAKRHSEQPLSAIIDEILKDTGLERMDCDVCHVPTESGK